MSSIHSYQFDYHGFISRSSGALDIERLQVILFFSVHSVLTKFKLHMIIKYMYKIIPKLLFYDFSKGDDGNISGLDKNLNVQILFKWALSNFA